MAPVLSGIFAVFLWACAPALIKVGKSDHDFTYFLLARYGVSALLTCMVAPAVIKKISSLNARTIVFSCFFVIIHNTCQVYCLKQISVCWYTLFFSLTPVLTIFFFTRFSWATLSYFLVAIVGVFLILEPGQHEFYPEAVYVMALLVSIFGWVFLTVFLKKLHKHFGDLETTFLLNFANLSAATVLWLSHGMPYEAFSSKEMTSLFLLSISSPIALYFFSYAIRKAPIFTISAQYIEIIFGLCIGVVFFNEHLKSNEWAGAFFIILSIVLTSQVKIRLFIKSKLS